MVWRWYGDGHTSAIVKNKYQKFKFSAWSIVSTGTLKIIDDKNTVLKTVDLKPNILNENIEVDVGGLPEFTIDVSMSDYKGMQLLT